MTANENISSNVLGATLSRGKFVKGTGALVVGLALPAAALTARTAKAGRDEVDPSQLSGWLTINADSTVTMRTGKFEFGQGSASPTYAQLVSEELHAPYAPT